MIKLKIDNLKENKLICDILNKNNISYYHIFKKENNTNNVYVYIRRDT